MLRALDSDDRAPGRAPLAPAVRRRLSSIVRTRSAPRMFSSTCVSITPSASLPSASLPSSDAWQSTCGDAGRPPARCQHASRSVGALRGARAVRPHRDRARGRRPGDAVLDVDPDLARVIDIFLTRGLEVAKLVEDLWYVVLQTTSHVAQTSEVAVRARPLAAITERRDRSCSVVLVIGHIVRAAASMPHGCGIRRGHSSRARDPRRRGSAFRAAASHVSPPGTRVRSRSCAS